jgi:plastocyanin
VRPSSRPRLRQGGCNRRTAGVALTALALLPLALAAETVEVVIQDYKFIPAQLTIKAGTTVKWTNAEKRTTHSVLFGGAGGLESERMFPGESWQRTFDTPGNYPYGCGPHPEMKGQIDVVP